MSEKVLNKFYFYATTLLTYSVRSTLPGTTWQRCKVHFMRNILAYVPQKDKEKVAAKLKLIWKAPDEKSARAMKNDFCEEYEKAFPKAVECLEEGFEDSVQFYAFEKLDSRNSQTFICCRYFSFNRFLYKTDNKLFA